MSSLAAKTDSQLVGHVYRQNFVTVAPHHDHCCADSGSE